MYLLSKQLVRVRHREKESEREKGRELFSERDFRLGKKMQVE